ncbi:hypothetical protein TNIN_401341 [Trichonephila inaurata madagascariensis]|uniref:Uncharacterized protein n=1 Tax=Trichonephila inaurata madagascariensis TaxID=2747483 RepID=A0A8X6JBG4_9ARAC|nr:hypothetical protein TNIN_401341 [Trichonephila inaurata madagascariensis]
MASSTECPLFPKPRKGTGKSATENRKRNEINQKTPMVIPGLTFAQVSNPNKSQQMAAQGNASSASNQNQSQVKLTIVKMKLLTWKQLMLSKTILTSLDFSKPS